MKKTLSIIAMLMIGTCAFAESVWVKVKSTKILDRESSRGKKVALVEYGTELEVIEKSGEFLKVRAASNENLPSSDWEGWISKKDASTRKLVTSSSANAKEVALAGRGLNAEVEGLYSQEKNIDFTVVDEIEKITVKDTDLSDFIRDGNLKEAE